MERSTYMVSIFTWLCKLGQLNISIQKMANCIISKFLLSANNYCRTCHAKGMHAFEKYERNVIDYYKGQRTECLLETYRYICDECRHTHVLLPSVLIPYDCYSLRFVLYALLDYFSKKMTVEAVCEKYGIAAPTLYRWKKMFLHDKELWLGVLKNAAQDEVQFIRDVFNEYNFKDFSTKLLLTQRNDLQLIL
jgi:hypothetical protein